MSAMSQRRGPRVRADIAPDGFPANLSPAERTAIEALLEHDTAVDVAKTLGCSIHTVRSHIESARVKAGVKSHHRVCVLFLQARGQA